jgi:transposase
VSHPEASSLVEQVPHHDQVEAASLKGATATVLAEVQAAENRAMPKRCVGIDLGKKLSLCEVQGDRVVQRVMLATRAELERVLGPTTAPARVAIEACREAWHYHDLLTSWGHRVLMVDTTRVRELGIGHGRRKNDRIDAEVLARAVQSGRIPLAHVLSAERREMRAELGIRRALVQTRAEFVVTVRGLLRSWGVKSPSNGTENFASNIDKMVRARELSKELYARIEPLITTLKAIEPQIKALDAKLEAMIEGVDIGKVLMTCPGVGSIVACSFVSVIDDAGRFRNAHQVEAYLGLVPSENTSGKRKLGSITKAGNAYLRMMLVQASWHVLRARADSALKLWGMSIAKKKGKSVAIVAIARRLAGILWAMWRDNKPYDPSLVGKASSQGLREQALRVDNTARAVEATA